MQNLVLIIGLLFIVNNVRVYYVNMGWVLDDSEQDIREWT